MIICWLVQNVRVQVRSQDTLKVDVVDPKTGTKTACLYKSLDYVLKYANHSRLSIVNVIEGTNMTTKWAQESSVW